jgi:hypothetical protein
MKKKKGGESVDNLGGEIKTRNKSDENSTNQNGGSKNYGRSAIICTLGVALKGVFRLRMPSVCCICKPNAK